MMRSTGARATGNLYDGDGNRIRVIHPDNSFFTYDLDGFGRPIRIREGVGELLARFSYDSAGRPATRTWPTTTSWNYDPAGRLQSLSHDLEGTSRDQTESFAYNNALQIVGRTTTNDAYAWSDSNTYVRSYAANGQNQYTATLIDNTPGSTFAYDLNGNLENDGLTAFVYDIENRLVGASGAKAATLEYDPLGRLFRVTGSGSGPRLLVYDGDALIAEYDSAGNMPHRYLHGNAQGVDDPILWYDNNAWGWRRPLLANHQGSIVQVSDMFGSPVATNSYDPWGIPGANNAGRFGYTGQAWVPELGLWYYKARFYSPVLGRFMQVDPVGYKDQMNLYAYVGNDPLNHLDPTGMTVILSGEEADRKRYIQQAQRLTGLKLREGAGRKLEQLGSRNSKIGFSEAANSLQKAMSSKDDVNINVVSNDPDITGDLLSSNTVDINDFEIFEGKSSQFAASLFAHVLDEYTYFAGSNKDFFAYYEAHAVGMRTEADMMGAAYRSNPKSPVDLIFNYHDYQRKVISSYSFPQSQIGKPPW